MYESHYEMTDKPFSIVPNPEVLFLSRNHENALTYLEYGLTEKVGFILLTGEIGTGKTTLIRHFLNRMESSMDIGVIFNTNFSSSQLFSLILSEFEVPGDSTDKDKNLETLYNFLIDQYSKNRHVLLIIDEAQNLTEEALEDVRMLSNLQTDDAILIQIMLVGQPELRSRLSMPSLRQLSQRIAVNYHLTPFHLEQTRLYIAYRIEKAGGKTDLFTPEAVAKIHEHSGGIPRTINLMCDSALVYGFADNKKTINENMIDQILKDNCCFGTIDVGVDERLTCAQSKTTEEGLPLHIQELETSIEEISLEVKRLSGNIEDVKKEMKNGFFSEFRNILELERKRFNALWYRYDQLKTKYQDLETSKDEDVIILKNIIHNDGSKIG